MYEAVCHEKVNSTALENRLIWLSISIRKSRASLQLTLGPASVIRALIILPHTTTGPQDAKYALAR